MSLVAVIPLFCAGLLGSTPFEEGDLLLVERLDRSALDYSVESVKEIDEWLTAVSLIVGSATEADYNNTVLSAGCYVGETIRRNSPVSFEWRDHAEYFEENPKLASVFPYGLGTAVVLARPDGITLPINKVLRLLHEGPENNLHFYVSGEVASR